MGWQNSGLDIVENDGKHAFKEATMWRNVQKLELVFEIRKKAREKNTHPSQQICLSSVFVGAR